MSTDDSDSDSGHAANSGTSASERTPLLAPVTASSLSTTVSVHGACGLFLDPETGTQPL